MKESGNTFTTANTALLVGPFTTEVFIQGRSEPLLVNNITGEARNNVSYASIMVFNEGEGGTTTKLPLGESTYKIDDGAILLSSCDSADVKIALGWT